MSANLGVNAGYVVVHLFDSETHEHVLAVSPHPPYRDGQEQLPPFEVRDSDLAEAWKSLQVSLDRVGKGWAP